MDTPAPRTPLTIIVVEDNPLDIYLIRWVLTAHALAHELQVIDNGDRAMDYVNQLAHEERRRSPTIMLLDLNLPQRDGREILQRVKAIPQLEQCGGSAGDPRPRGGCVFCEALPSYGVHAVRRSHQKLGLWGA
jgi:CheY-like chemotaxis protein